MNREGLRSAASPIGTDRSTKQEQDRVADVYGRYSRDGRHLRWMDDLPGNRCILAERRSITSRLILGRPRPTDVLEVGCGAGSVMAELREILGPGPRIVGVDLLADRLTDASTAGQVLQADGRSLPFVDDQFDLVVAFTVFSSVLDEHIRKELASEIVRVLRPSGAVLLYDMRLQSTNRQVRPISRKSIQRYFPDMTCHLSSCTVLPPLIRSTGAADRFVYPALRAVPALRTHLIGLIEVSARASDRTSG